MGYVYANAAAGDGLSGGNGRVHNHGLYRQRWCSAALRHAPAHGLRLLLRLLQQRLQEIPQDEQGTVQQRILKRRVRDLEQVTQL